MVLLSVRTCGFKRNSSNLDKASKMRKSPAEFLRELFSDPAFNLVRNLGDVLLRNSGNRRVL